jgi:hypothetical protein
MSSNSPVIAEWLQRLEVVEQRLAREAEKTGGMTTSDATTGEVWERGQVWGHLAEFVNFWTEQVGDVIDEYQGEPIHYGRTRDDPGRVAGIDSGLDVSIGVLWQEVRSDIADLQSFLGALPEGWEKAVGAHPTRGSMNAREIIDDHLISHLEEHAAQLENIT